MPRPKKQTERANSGANLGFEEKLWRAADEMRGHEEVSRVAKMKRLTGALKEQFAESGRLEKEIRENLKKVGYGF